MERKLVSIKQIDAITPIEGADRIELAHLGGWGVVVGKGEFTADEMVFYFEVDSMLPLGDTIFEFLRPRGTKVQGGVEYHRLKTAKLRGEISQGLVIGYRAGMDYLTAKLGKDEDEVLGLAPDNDFSELFEVVKYEDPITVKLGGDVYSFPADIPKTDEERIQNLPEVLEQITKDNSFVEWLPTEKIDGTSITIYYRSKDTAEQYGDKLHDGLGVCSRNMGLKYSEENTYWQTALDFKIMNLDGVEYSIAEWAELLCKEGAKLVVLQGELFGEGIQKNPLGMKGLHIRFYNLIIDGVKQPYLTIQTEYRELLEHWVPVFHGLELGHTMEEIVAQPDGLTSVVPDAKKNQIEGIVWRNIGKTQLTIKGRKTADEIDWDSIPKEKWELVKATLDRTYPASFKAISNKYLLKHE